MSALNVSLMGLLLSVFAFFRNIHPQYFLMAMPLAATVAARAFYSVFDAQENKNMLGVAAILRLRFHR